LLSVILPAFNEEKTIVSTLETLIYFLYPIFKDDLEIIIVDDGSLDETVKRVRQVQNNNKNNVTIKLLENNRNRGKGFTVKQGVQAAAGDIIIFTDADLSYDIQSIVYLASKISVETPVVIGSRMLPTSQINANVSLLRSLTGKIFNFFVQSLLLLNIKDTQCGLKGFTKKVAKEIFPLLKINGFAFDVELLFLIKKHHHKIFQVPVNLIKNRKDSRLNIGLDPFKMFMDIVSIRFNDALGKYDNPL